MMPSMLCRNIEPCPPISVLAVASLNARGGVNWGALWALWALETTCSSSRGPHKGAPEASLT